MNEITFKNYKTIKRLNNTELKGMFKWTFTFMLLCIMGNSFGLSETDKFTGIASWFIIGSGFVLCYDAYDNFTNEPHLLMCSPISKKKLIKYDILYYIYYIFWSLMILVLAFSVICLINNKKFDYFIASKGYIFTTIILISIFVSIYPLSYEKIKSKWYTKMVITIVFYTIANVILVNLCEKTDKFIVEGNLSKDFNNLPNQNAFLAGAVIFFIVNIIISAVRTKITAEKY